MWKVLVLTTMIISLSYAKPLAKNGANAQDNLPVTCDRISDKTINYFCPDQLHADIVMRIERSGKRAEIECKSAVPTVFEKLADIDVGSTETVEFISCPINSLLTIINIFVRLGIRDVHNVTHTVAAVDA